MIKPPQYVTLQPVITELLDHEWMCGEPEYLFDLNQIIHFTGRLASKTTYRKALKALTSDGAILFLKPEDPQEPHQWCSILVRGRFAELQQERKKKIAQTWMAEQDLQQLHKTLMSQMEGGKSLRQAKQFGVLEDHVQDFWVKILENGFSTLPDISQLTTWSKRNAYSTFREWSQDLSLTISRGALNDVNRNQFTRVVVDYESYNNQDLGEARMPPLQETRIEGLELMEELRDEFLDAWRIPEVGERYFRMYAAQKLGYTAPEIGAFEGISGNRTSTILQYGRDYVKNRQNLLADSDLVETNQNG